MIVVIDTNVWISALQFSRSNGLPRRALERAQSCDTIALSDELEAEIYRILILKFQWQPRSVQEALNVVLKRFVRVTLEHNVHLCRDPKDDMFLECAAIAQC